MVEYGNVVLTLNNVILPPEKVFPNPTPSMNDGLSWNDEYDLRLIGCELIQTAGLLLKLPQTAVATGQVLFHRYFYGSSFVRRPMEIFAMACINLAAKIEENARRVRDVMNVFHHIKQVRSGSLIHPMLIDQAYIDRKNEVIRAERRLLKELGFCVYVKHPHKMIILYLRMLERENDKNLVQSAWNYMNDSLRTDVFLRFKPETIACACIDLASRILEIPLPQNPTWFLSFGARPEEIRYITIAILRLYNHRPKPISELERIVTSVREARDAERKKSRFDVGNESPSISQPTPVFSQSVPVASTQEAMTSIVVPTESTAGAITTIDLTTNGKSSPLEKRADSRESSVVQNSRRRRKRTSSRSRSSSKSRSRSRSRSRSVKKKKASRRSRSRSSTPKRRKHQKEKRHHGHSSNHHRKKDRKRRSPSSSPEDDSRSNQKHKPPLTTKDTNNGGHHRSHHHHHHSSKSINGVSSSSSSSQKKLNSK